MTDHHHDSAVAGAPDPSIDVHVAGQLDGLQQKFELLQAQVRQAQQMAMLGTVATTIAHEVNNLLTPILSYASAAVSARDPELQEKALQVTIKHVRMLISMSERILRIGAARTGKRESVSLRAVVDDAIESLCRDPSKDGITLSVNMDDSLTAWVDPLQLQQVLFNLMLNARQAMARHHGGRMSISGRLENDKVILKVSNTGDPIPPDLLPHLFNTLESSRPLSDNSATRCHGLGLALCHDLIEDNGGTIRVESSTAQGATFTLELPAHPDRDQEGV